MFGVEKPAARRGWASWLAFGLFGLLATGAGVFAPGITLNDQSAAPAAVAIPNDSLEYTPPSLPDFPSPRAMFLRVQ
jgi:hypothetical protein